MHGASMKMDKDGSLKVDQRNENHIIFTKRFFNNVLGTDMKKQSVLCMITGHFKHEEIKVHPWKIDFIAKDVNFDNTMDKTGELKFDSILENREIELNEMFQNILT
jgi:UDP-2,3-diacylglucosamine pyrophosphatase LpxH